MSSSLQEQKSSQAEANYCYFQCRRFRNRVTFWRMIKAKLVFARNSAKTMLISISVLWSGFQQNFHFPAFGGMFSFSLVAIKKKIEQPDLTIL